MPDFVTSTGQTVTIPGIAEYRETVILSEPGPMPRFNVPVLVGAAHHGIPYNFDSVKEASEPALGAFRQCRTDAFVNSLWGYSSDIAVAFRHAVKAGLPLAFVASTSKLTRAKVLVTSTGPVNQFIMYSRLFGAVGGHHKVAWVDGVMTITPVKNYALLASAVASGATRIYVQGADPNYSPIAWLSEGATIEIGDNDTANEALVVAGTGRELVSGQYRYYVDLVTGPASAIEVSTKYGMIVQYSDDSEVSPAFSAGEGQLLVDWLNTSSLTLGATKHANFSGVLPIEVESTPLKEIADWSTVTVGTSPAPVAQDWTDFLDAYVATGWDKFRALNGVNPRMHLFLTSDATVQTTTIRDFAVNRRSNKTPVSVLLGCAFTDTSCTATDHTNPGHTNASLNHQDIALFAGQWNYLAPYLSLAADAFGKLAAGTSRYSITSKPLAIAGDVTHLWDEDGSGELSYLIRKGVVTYRLSESNPPVWQFTAGVNSSQDRATAWSPTSNTTCMIAARNCIDEYAAGLLSVLSTFVGRTSTDGEVGMAIYTYNLQAQNRYQTIESFGSPSITQDASTLSWSVTPSVTPPSETLFIGVYNQIIIR